MSFVLSPSCRAHERLTAAMTATDSHQLCQCHKELTEYVTTGYLRHIQSFEDLLFVARVMGSFHCPVQHLNSEDVELKSLPALEGTLKGPLKV